MIGSHELLLIVRAQNQAAAALGRVSRDLRRMSAQRDMELRRAAIANRLARNSIQQAREQARIDSVLADNGAAKLAHNQALARNAFQQLGIQDRITNLEVRRTGIARALTNVEIQKMRVQAQELRIEQSLEKVELRRQAINAQIGRLGTQLLRNGVQEQALNRQAYGLQTQLLERQLRYNKARRALAAAERGDAGSTKVNDLRQMANIARRRIQETKMAQASVPGQRAVLGSVGSDIRAQIVGAQGAFAALKNDELQLAKASEILTTKHASLAAQLANVQARSTAVDGAERQLQAELKIVSDQVGILNARWEQHVAVTGQAARSLKILQAEEANLNIQLAEQDALLAGQARQLWADRSRAIGHFGRVVQMAGLVTTAAFGFMAVGAANFNKEATRVATQTGPITSGTAVVVKNAERVQNAIVELMKQVPADQGQLTDALYNIYSSMNTTFGDGTRLLKLFTQVWEAGGMQGNVNEVADALITLGNNWNINARDMESWQKLAASTLATVRFGRLTVEQYTQTMNQLAPAFHGAHQSIEQMNGAIAFMTRLLPSQRMSAAGLARFMEIIGRFAAKPASGFEQLAKDIQDANGNLLPLNQIMDIFIKQFPKLQTSGVFLQNFLKMISNQQGTVQARRALQALVQQNDLYNQTLKNTSTDQREFNRSLRAMERSTGVKWAQFVNDMRALGLEVGTAALPAFIKFGSVIQRVVKWYDGLNKSTKDSIASGAAYAAIAALIGGTLLAVIGSMAAMVISLRVLGGSKGFTGLTKIMGSSKVAGEALAGEAGFISLRFGMVAGGLVLLIPLLIRFHTQIGHAAQSVGGLNTVIKILSTLATIWTVQTIINGFMAITTQADVATGAVKRTRLALLGLNALTVGVAISVGIIETPQYKAFRKWLRTHGGQEANDLFANVGDQIKSAAGTGKHLWDLTAGWPAYSKKMDKQKYKNSIDVRNLWRLVSQGAMNAATLRLYKPYLDSADYDALMHHARLLSNPPARGTTGRGTAGVRGAVNAIQNVNRDSWIVRQVAVVANLQKIWEKAPSPKNWRAFHNTMNRITSGMTKEQKSMFDDLLSSFMSNTRDAEKLDDKAAKRRIANAQNAAALIKQTTQSIQQMMETSLQNSQQQFGELFSGRFITKSAVVADRSQFGFGLRKSDLMRDLQMQVKDFGRFNSSIATLQRRGAPQEMIKQIQAMGPEAQRQIGLLLRLTPAQFKHYVAMFNQGQKEIQKAAERDVNAQLTRWNRFGKNVSRAIINGIRSQNPELEDAVAATVQRMFPGLSKQAGKLAPKAATHNETHNYHIGSGVDPSGIKTAIKEANFAYKVRKSTGW